MIKINRIFRVFINRALDKEKSRSDIRLIPGVLGLYLIFEYLDDKIFGKPILDTNLVFILTIIILFFLSWFFIYCSHVLPKENKKKYELLIEPIKTDKKYFMNLILFLVFLIAISIGGILLILGLITKKGGELTDYLIILSLTSLLILTLSFGDYALSGIRYKRSKMKT